MGSEYWLQFNNGKKEQIKEMKHGIRRDQLDEKYHNIFDAYDVNGDGTLEASELEGIRTSLGSFAGKDKILNAQENTNYASIFAASRQEEGVDFQGFLKAASAASEEIEATTEKSLPDGGKMIVTKYRDGMVETIAYYPDGTYKFKRQEKHSQKTGYVLSTDMARVLDEKDINSRIKREYARDKKNYEDQNRNFSFGKELKTYTISVTPYPSFEEYKAAWLKKNNLSPYHSEEHIDKIEFSDFAKEDSEIRANLLTHFLETHEDTKDLLNKMGFMADTGAFLNRFYEKLKEWCGGDASESYYDLKKGFENDMSLAEDYEQFLAIASGNPTLFFTTFENDFKSNFGHAYDFNESSEFLQLAGEYNQATALMAENNSLTDVITKANSLKFYSSALTQRALNLDVTCNTDAEIESKYEDLEKALKSLFEDDEVYTLMTETLKKNDKGEYIIEDLLAYLEELRSINTLQLYTIMNPTAINVEEMLASGVSSDEEVVAYQKGLIEGSYNAFLGKNGLSSSDKDFNKKLMALLTPQYEQMKTKYNNEYKKMYNTNFVPDALNDKIMEAQATGGMVKLGAITIISLMITRGKAPKAVLRWAAEKWGPQVAKYAVNFLMSTGTIAVDSTLTMMDMLSSKDGVRGGELLDSTLGSAKYIYYGSFIGAPIASAVSKGFASKITGLRSALFKNGTAGTLGNAIRTTTVTGEQFVTNMMEKCNSLFYKGSAFAANLGTEIGMFSALEVATAGKDVEEALTEQGSFLPKLKVMNHVLEYMLGAITHRSGNVSIKTGNPKFDLAMERSGIKDWTIKEIQDPNGTKYSIERDGIPIGIYDDPLVIAEGMVERVTATYVELFGENGDKVPPELREKTEETKEPETKEAETKEETVSEETSDTEGSSPEMTPEEKYQALRAEYERTGVMTNELLGLTFDLMDKGYKMGSNGKLDFEPENPEIVAALKAKGIDPDVINNVNRINLEVLNAIDNPEILLSEFGIAVLCDVKPEDVAFRIDMYNAVKDMEHLPVEAKITYICEANREHFDFYKERAQKVNSDIQFLKESGIEPELLQAMTQELVSGHISTLNRELFIQLRDSGSLNTDLALYTKAEDGAARAQVDKLLENLDISAQEKQRILSLTTRENLGKILKIESMRAEAGASVIQKLYSQFEEVSLELLESVDGNAGILDYYSVSDLSKMEAEVVAAKNAVIKTIEENSIGLDEAVQIVKATTPETVDKNIASVKLINALYSNKHLATTRNTMIQNVVNGTIDASAVRELYDAVKDCSWINHTKVFDGLNATDAQAKLKAYDVLKTFVDDDYEVILYLNRVNASNFDSIMVKIKEMKVVQEKIAAVDAIKEPTFSQKELAYKRSQMLRAEELIDGVSGKGGIRIKAGEKQQLLDLLEGARNIEEFQAKYRVLVSLIKNSYGSSEAKNMIDLVKRVKISEQADVIINLNIPMDHYYASYSTQMLDSNFAGSYTYLKQIDGSVAGLDYSRNMTDLNGVISDIDTPEAFEQFKQVWNDKTIAGNLVKKFVSSPEKFELYSKLKNSPEFKKLSAEERKKAIEAVAYDKLPDVSDAAQVLIQLKATDLISRIAQYRKSLDSDFVYSDVNLAENLMNILNITFNIPKELLQDLTSEDLSLIHQVIAENRDYSFAEFTELLSTQNLKGCGHRSSILALCSSDVKFHLTFCTDEVFQKYLEVFEARPEMLAKKIDWSTFEKIVSMTDAEWNNYKTSLQDRAPIDFDAAQFANEVQAQLDQGFELDMSVYQDIERQRNLSANSRLGMGQSKVVKFNAGAIRPTSTPRQAVTVEALLEQLATTGSVNVSIEDQGGMKPVRTDAADIKDRDRARLGQPVTTDIVLNIGASRPWENSRLARDLIQNFYDGNGYTMEGVDISVENVGGKYKIKVSGKGLFDYDRVLNFGFGSKAEDTRSAGQHGEGSKIVLGNLLYSRGAEHVKYSAGEWELDFTKGVGDTPATTEIMQTLTEAREFQNGTSLEFETTDLDLVKEILKAKDYFYSPENPDFQGLDFENDYFAIKLLPKGEKGNVYVIQRYEVDGAEGLDGTLDGMTLIFKTKPEDEGLTKLNDGKTLSLESGRNRVALNKDKITEMIARYAQTLSDEELTNVIGSLSEIYLYDNQNPNVHILRGFTDAAAQRGLKIDFGHDAFVAVPVINDPAEIEFARIMGKVLVQAEMNNVGVPALWEYMRANSGQRIPITDLTATRQQKLQILNEAINVFSDYLDLAHSDIISTAEANAPRYVYSRGETKDNTRAEAILNPGTRQYKGHWVLDEYMDNGSFFEMMATWLHEISHKVAGDGSMPFNERLMTLEQLIVDISCSDPSFGQKLAVLKTKFDEVAGTTTYNHSVDRESVLKETELRIATLLEAAVEECEATARAKQEAAAREEAAAATQPVDRPNIVKRWFNKLFGKTSGTSYEPTFMESVRVMFESRNKKRFTFAPQALVSSSEAREMLPTAPSPEANLATLDKTGSVVVSIPTTDRVKAVKGDTSIKPEDRAILGQVVNTPLMMDYNSAQEWTYDMVARDILQNFYDGHGQTLDGVKFEVVKVGNKYKVKISGQSEFSYFFLKAIAASTKTGDANQAGGYGEGAKMASKTMLGSGITDKVTFASGDWTLDFAREEGVERQNMHMTRTLTENPERVDGTFIEFETENVDFIESILKAKDFYSHSENPDFQGLDFENEYFGFKVLDSGEAGNLYYNQRFAIKTDGELEGALKGLSIVFKKEISPANRERYGIANDCDRRGLTGKEINSIAQCMARTMSDAELMNAIQRLFGFLEIDLRLFEKSNYEASPETNFVLGLVKEANKRRLDFDLGDAKYASYNRYEGDTQALLLQNLGYKLIDGEARGLGFRSTRNIWDKVNSVTKVDATPVEAQKLVLLQEIISSKLPLKLFEAMPQQKPVMKDVNDGLIAIDRNYLANADFNTLYTEILSQIHYEMDAARYGYSLTNLLGHQLELAHSEEFRIRFNAIKQRFEELK